MGFWDKVMKIPYDRDPFKGNGNSDRGGYRPDAWRDNIPYNGYCDFSPNPNSRDSGSSASGSYRPDEWRRSVPYNDPFDSHIYDNGSLDNDGDGYCDGSVGDF